MANNKNNTSSETAKRGFASMDKDRLRDVAREGGKETGGNFKNDPERASEAGKKVGEASHGGQSSAKESSTSSEGGRSGDTKGGSGDRS